jgi:anthranilate phosphoribosyltransferase
MNKNMIKKGIQKLVNKIDLTHKEATEIIKEVMTGKATATQIGSLITSLRMKGETIQEISAFATGMKEYCFRIYPKIDGRLVDIVGTGGDLIKTFNVSTTSAFVVAGTKTAVAKHGNRSVTSRSGSADVLEKLGYNLNLEPRNVKRIIEQVGIGYMFAPKFHPAMKHAVGPRKEIGIRTIFNILGPLTNPADANALVLGVYKETWLKPLAYVLKKQGCKEAIVVYGMDGLDEISIIGKTSIAWLKNGKISLLTISPGDFGFKVAKPDEISGSNPEANAELMFNLLNDTLPRLDPKRITVLLNAAAGIVVGGKVDNIAMGVELARESIESGAAYRKLRMMIKASGGDLERIEELEKKYG